MKRGGKFAFARDFTAEHSFFASAERINEILRAGAVAPHERAGLLAAVLLTWPQRGTRPNHAVDPVQWINRAAGLGLKSKAGTGSHLLKQLRIAPPGTSSGREKLARALVGVRGELERLYADGMLTTGDDCLGRFYEVFVKHGGWARDLGVVLTPPHLARFAAHVLDLNGADRIYDPTCGTGGFLTAALECTRGSGEVFGLEQEPGMASLALANMLLRGRDGKSVRQGDCLADQRKKNYFTKVMMNPPFAVKGVPEFRFVEKALESLQPGGLLFAVLPYAVLVRPGLYKTHRRKILLRENTLLAVLTLPEELFHPVGVPTVAVVLRKGRPESNAAKSENERVLWARVLSDGMRISKGRRLPDPGVVNELDKLSDALRGFLREPSAAVAGKRRSIKVAAVDPEDSLLELVPEAYVDDVRPALGEIIVGVEAIVRESLSAMVKAGRADFESVVTRAGRSGRSVPHTKWKTFRVDELFRITPGDFHSLSQLAPGPWPTISRAGTDNGVAGYFEKPARAMSREPGTITVSTVTGDAFVQFMPYLATDNVLVCEPAQTLPPAALYFMQFMINRNRWRNSYGRQCYLARFRRTRISLPVAAKGNLNLPWMKRMMETAPYWPFVQRVMEKAGAEKN